MIFTQEQLLIQKTAKEFAINTLKPISSKLSEKALFPIDIIKQLSELGFMGMLVPEEFNGTNLDYLSYCLVIEELAAGDASISTILSVHNSLTSNIILKYGTKKQKELFLPDLASGKKLGAFCLTESEAGSDAANLQTKAVLENNNYILNGTKQFITSGKHADLAIVFAKTNPELNKKGISAFIVPTNNPGYKANKIEKKMGQEAAETVEIVLDNLSIPKEYLLGELNQGYKIALSNLELGRVSIAAQSVGIAKEALELSINYSKERETFGTKIINHQAISFRLAEMSTKLEVARNMIYTVANLIDNKIPCLKQAAIAKLFACDIAEEICKDAIQIHGGYGYLKDFRVEQLYRDVRVTSLYEGTSDIQKLIIAREILNNY